MIRLGIVVLLVVGGLTAGCASSGKVVVQDGYRGITQAPTGYEPQRPGALTLPPEETRVNSTTVSAVPGPEAR